jgi:uncharacterized protein YwqG
MDDREITSLFAKAGHEHIGAWLVANKRPGVRFVDAGKRGFSKLGGVPDVPSGFAWPVTPGSPMAFLAQIDLAEASRHDRDGLLPRSGRLWFFYDYVASPWGFDPAHRNGWKVLFDATGGAVAPARVPGPTLGEDSDDEVFPERPVGFEHVMTYPDLESWEGHEELDDDAREGLDEASEQLSELLGEDEESERHQLLGHAMPVQGPMELECQLTSNGIYTGGGELKPQDEKRAEVLAAGASDWTLLLQLDSDEALWMWGDCGRLFFWIRKQDLARKDFSNVWVVLQCF